MLPYIVLYRTPGWDDLADHPLAFRCMADDTDHAEEQLVNAEPRAVVLWAVITDDVEVALDDYYNGWEE